MLGLAEDHPSREVLCRAHLAEGDWVRYEGSKKQPGLAGKIKNNPLLASTMIEHATECLAPVKLRFE